MTRFVFESYSFASETGDATFCYRYDDGRRFQETVRFSIAEGYNQAVLERALFLSFSLIGVSYVKTFLASECVWEAGSIDEWQATFLNSVYQEGLSQFAYENKLTRDDLPHFTATSSRELETLLYNGEGILLLQSGGKDSLLLASLLDESGQEYTPWYLANADHHPEVLDALSQPLVVSRRHVDIAALKTALTDGAKNGHVPVTYIVQSLALVQAILLGKQTVLTAIAHEGEEPHAFIGDLPVTHQWSKTWQAEQRFAEYVQRYIAPSLQVGSPLRKYSELRVAELFVQKAWDRFGHQFSSCNRANYQQGKDNTTLTWCGDCPKCANSYLLFAPFLDASKLQALFGGKDLFTSESLQQTYKGLLGVDDVMKPFECIGEVDELRAAYVLAQEKGEYGSLSFTVPNAKIDRRYEYPVQPWANIL